MRYEEFKFEDIEVGDELQWKSDNVYSITKDKHYIVNSIAPNGVYITNDYGSITMVKGRYLDWNLIKQNNLPKVQSLPPFKDMKFRVENEEHSKQIQEYLFSIGYKWDGEWKDIVPIDTIEYILTDSSGWIDWDYISNFNEDFRKEYKLIPHTTYSIEPVIPKIEVVNILGKQYNKSDVEELLKTLEEVQ